MSKKIIGITVGTQLPKPNFKQTDPTKGDYIKNKPDFDGLKSRIVDVEDTLISIIDPTLSIEGKAADAKATGDAISSISALVGNKPVSEQISEAMREVDVDLTGYATETYVDNAITAINHPVSSVNGKTGEVKLSPADIGAQPIGDYALRSEIPTVPVQSVNNKVGAVILTPEDIGAQVAGNYITEETDPTVPAWAKATTKPAYTASEVGADPVGTATSAVTAHNTAANAHNDMRLLIEGLTTRLNTLADSDDTTLDQMSEIVTYIKSNKSLIEDVTTNKVNVSDIIDNLTTNVTNKPLSAAQGVALKALIDSLDTDKLDASALTSAVNGALAQAKASGEFDGADGVGVSSVKQTTTSTADDGNNVITVTLSNGTTSTFTVQNGSKGSKGDKGDSPVRGTDYWTDADKAEIKSYVDEAILGGAW